MIVYRDPVRRFWMNVEKTDTCWNWMGKCRVNGYGVFMVEGKTMFVHRFSYKHHHGSIPEGLCVCHHCDNRKCVRPSHLFAGTHTDNMQDAWRKGRMETVRLADRSKSRFTKQQIQDIRIKYKSGVKPRFLRKEFSISHTHLHRILNGGLS